MAMFESLEQETSGFVIPHYTDGKDVHPQFSKIVDGISCSAGNHRALAVFQDEDRGFARDARNLAKDELVGHQITKNCNGNAGKYFDDLQQPLVFVMFGQKWILSASSSALQLFRDGAQNRVYRIAWVDQFHLERGNEDRLQCSHVFFEIDGILFRSDKPARLMTLSQLQEIANVTLSISVVVRKNSFRGQSHS